MRRQVLRDRPETWRRRPQAISKSDKRNTIFYQVCPDFFVNKYRWTPSEIGIPIKTQKNLLTRKIDGK